MFKSLATRGSAACHRLMSHQYRSIGSIKVDALFGKYQVITANEKDSLRSVAQIMEKQKIGAVMIENEKKQITGILTARDVQSAVADSADVSNVKAEDVMTPKGKLTTAKKGDSIKTLATLMMDKNIRHMLVLRYLDNI